MSKRTTTSRRKSSPPTYDVLDITPAAAEEILARNTHNRNLRRRIVAGYALDMAAGTWPENGESIKIATDGTVIDGQHRLAAIVESGTTQRMLVVANLPMQVQETVDGGAKRTFGDILKLRQETHYSAVAALCRRVVLWEAGVRRGDSARFQPTTHQMLAVLDAYPEIRDSAAAGMATGAAVPIQPAAASLCHWLTHRIDAQDCAWFFEHVRTGENLRSRHPVMTLRRTLTQPLTARARLPEVVTTAYTIKAWNAFREGREIGVLRFVAGGAKPEAFPEPQ
ncbi:hypothetical protein NLX83_39625 [Allokutzneria sp. A3M-2-11 16]|uniref:hypothetical protein n=1 Tax=Allokutzneria sp. A3M-2-11 16 TaxID=2962043 RepID=UPI0020B8AA45|nr:hypothetical protein [Allokutzneria sp. A3M-2-11 16]MCP3805395.1 hypothetical protein [Allokutzneria sp. A3M-2-11 16]